MIKFNQKTFSNGLRFITAPISSSEAVTVFILVGVGGRFEKENQAGISHFLEHLFFKGTKKRPTALQIARELDTLGAEYNAFTGEEYTGFYIKSAAKDFAVSLEILADMFLNSTLPEAEIEREKGVIIEEANMRRDVPQVHVQVLSQKQMFSGHPLGRDLVGTPETIKPITREDIVGFRNRGYNPESTIVAVCGNPLKFDWEEEIKKALQARTSGSKAQFEKYNLPKIAERVVLETRKVDQSHFVLSALTFPKTDPRRWALATLSTILGGGMSSRLFSEIRERRGWAYYVRSEAGAFHDTGYLDFFAGVTTGRLEDSVKLVLKEIEDIKQNGPTGEELKRAKANLQGHLALSLEDSFEIADFLADSVLYEDKVRQPEEIAKNIEKVTAQDVKRLSQEIFTSDRMGLAVITSKDIKGDLEKLF